MLMPPSQSD